MAFSGFAFRVILGLFVVLAAAPLHSEARGGGKRQNPWDPIIRWPTDRRENEEKGTRWAVLVAGSNGFGNYRHQVTLLLNRT